MSQFVIYVTLKPFIREWLLHSFEEPVVFPASSNENAIIRTFIQRLPKSAKVETNENGNKVAIAIPDSKAKPPMYYNYMGTIGKKALVEAIEDLFLRNLWAELGHASFMSAGKGVNVHIAAWCELHGISLDYVENVRQRYYRLRTAYTEKGIELRNFSKEK